VAIIESKKLADVLNYVDSDTLVMFDVDNTLIEPKTTLGGVPWFDYMMDKFQKQGLSEPEAIEKVYTAWMELQYIISVKPVEEQTPLVIKQLHERKVKTMGLTARGFMLAEKTDEQLASVGISLADDTIFQEEIIFTQHTGFYKGVLSIQSHTDKGEWVTTFLERINYSPKKVVFVDDLHKFVVQVESAFIRKNVPFTGIRYGAIDNCHVLFDPARAEEELKAAVAGTEREKILTTIF
jgi:hypothetical protein